VVGEKISCEEEFFVSEEKATVSQGVTREAHDFQSGDGVTGVKPLVYLRRLEAKEKAPGLFQAPADPAPTAIAMTPRDMIAVAKGGVDFAVRELLQRNGIKSVIEMPVGEKKAANIGEGHSALCEGFFDTGDPADIPAVNEVNVITLDDEMVLDEEASKLDDFPHGLKVTFFLRKTNDGCFLTRNRCASLSPCPYE
jgi:hypothetical protein